MALGGSEGGSKVGLCNQFYPGPGKEETFFDCIEEGGNGRAAAGGVEIRS